MIESARRLSSTELEETSEAELQGNIDLVALLRELRTIITPEYERCGVRIEWEVAKAIPPVHVDRSGLLQVLLNLARNSRTVLQESPKPKLKIAAYALSDSVLIRFADNGPGILFRRASLSTLSTRCFFHGSWTVCFACNCPNLGRRTAPHASPWRMLFHH